ncbi:MAG TPA: VTT domain-containing protein [Blastocatellia bacterium]|nr:VTT domain-containing protein [Blastocatellia bacterium]
MNNLLFILLGIKQSLQTLAEWLVTLGPLGLFAISLIDSAGLPLPGGPDAVMILLTTKSHALMPLYAVAASLGSTIGCTMMYWVARRAGMLALRKIEPARRARIENLLGRYDMLAIMATAILPPPFPFKPFVLSAGVFKLKLSRFIIAVFAGRLVRFTIEGLLAIAFGEAAGDQIKRYGLKVLLVVAVAATMLIIYNILRSRRARGLASPELQPPIE